MKYTLRPYQADTLRRLREAVRGGRRRIVLAAPTGSGKTILAAAVIEAAMAKGSRIVFLAHRRELIEQCSNKLDDIGVDHGVIQANHWRRRPTLPVQVASIQTLVRRDKPQADLLIVDECHRCLAKTYVDLITGPYRESALLGLTATPWRTDGAGLGRLYQDIVVTATVQELVDQGYLIAPRVFAPTTPDLTGIASTAGDYKQDELSARMDKSEIVGDIVDHWQRLANGRRTVAFATSIKHSQHIAEAFQVAGIAAEHVDGKMAVTARDAVLGRLRSGETTIVSNCDVVTEGYDLPVLSCAIMARPTQSSVKHLQMIGRIMRTVDGKTDALVLDHAGCTLAHGFVTDHRDMTLDDKKKKQSEPTVKVCKQCFAVIPAGVSRCPECGDEQPQTAQRSGPRERDGELQEIQPGNPGACTKCGSELTSVVRTNKLGKFTQAIKCHACANVEFRVDRAAAQRATMDEKREEFARIDAIRIAKNFATGWTAHRYRGVFGVWPRGIT